METQIMPVRRSIYAIESDYLQLMQRIEDSEGILDDELSEALAINEKELTTKAVNYTYIIKEYKDEADKAQREIDRITKLKVRAEKNAADLEVRIKEAMLRYGIDKIESKFVKLSLTESKAVVIGNDTKVPPKYLNTKITTSADKVKLKVALMAGEEIEGVWIQTNKNLKIQ